VNPSKLTASPLAADNTIEGAKSDVARLAETDPSLLGRTDSTPVNVMIKYDYDSTASYDGGMAGLAATSPNVTGKELEANKGAVDAYENYTSAVSDKIDKAVESAVPGAVVKQTFQTVYGGVSAVVPADQISKLLKVDGVVAVQKDSLRQPDYQSVSWIGAPTVWNKAGGSDNAARGRSSASSTPASGRSIRRSPTTASRLPRGRTGASSATASTRRSALRSAATTS
jgi:hypothetical protein